MSNRIRKLLQNQSGATAIEYGLIAGLIALVIIAAVGLLGTDLQASFQGMADAF